MADAVALAAQIKATKATLKGKKANLTRTLNQADASLARLTQSLDGGLNPTQGMVEMLANLCIKFQAAFDAYSATIDTLLAEDPDAEAEYIRVLESASTDVQNHQMAVENLQLTLSSKLAESSSTASIASASSGESAGSQIANSGKPNSTLKPFRLTKEHKPVDLTAWKTSYRWYYNTSGMAKHHLGEQQGYFYNCLDPYLTSRLESKVKEDTPIFHLLTTDQVTMDANPSCFALLTQEFLIVHPLNSRRFQYYSYVHDFAGRQKFSDFIAKVMKLHTEADIANLSVDDALVMKFLTGIQDNKLQDELLKLTKPTLEMINAHTLQYETNQNFKKDVSGNRANSVSGGRQREGRQRDRPQNSATRSHGSGRNAPTSNDRSSKLGNWDQDKAARLRERGTCNRCGKPVSAHDSTKCWNDTPCANCARFGHVTKTCCYKNTMNESGDNSRRSRNNDRQSRSEERGRPAERSSRTPSRGRSQSRPAARSSSRPPASTNRVTVHTISAENCDSDFNTV